MRKAVSEVWIVLHTAHQRFSRDLGALQAGAVAFFASLSLVPLGLLLVSVFGRLVGSEEAYRHAETLVREYLPGAGEPVLRALASAGEATGRWVVDVIGVLALLWSAMNLFATLSVILTVVWSGAPRRGFFKRKLVGLVALGAAGMAFLASALATSALAAVTAYAGDIEVLALLLQRFGFLDAAAVWILHAALAATTFFLVYWLLPAPAVSPRAAAVSAAPAVALWMVSRSAFSTLVVGSSRYGQVYGPLAGAVVLLLWIYYSAYIMIFCAEIGAVAQRRYWSREPTAEGAMAAEGDKGDPPGAR